MHSVPARTANSHYTTRIRPALASFVDEVCGTLARLCLYLMTLALMAICGIALWHHLPDVTRWTVAQNLEPGRAQRARVRGKSAYFPKQDRGLRSFSTS
jgi:hypothetical protein